MERLLMQIMRMFMRKGMNAGIKHVAAQGQKPARDDARRAGAGEERARAWPNARSRWRGWAAGSGAKADFISLLQIE